MSTREPAAGDIGDVGAGAIDRYLDRLFDSLGGSGAPGRRVLAEAESHLFAAYEDNVQHGMAPTEAAQEAIARFGSTEVIGASTRSANAMPVGTVVRKALSGAWLVGTIGLLCLGISGLLSRVLGHLAGPAFLAADPSGTTYTAARCREYLEYAPGASNCTQAAISHHFSELVFGREAAGVLGLLCVGVAWLFLRRADSRWRPPIGVTTVVGAVTAALVAVNFASAGGLAYVFGARDGFGALFPDAAAALIGAAFFATMLIRRTQLGRGDATFGNAGTRGSGATAARTSSSRHPSASA